MTFPASKPSGGSRSPIRIGAAIGPHDPYWVQVREAAYHRVAELGATLVPLEISDTNETLFSLDPASLAEELLAQDLSAVVCQTLPLGTIYQLVYQKMPVIFLGESQLQHRLFSSPRGLSEAGKIAAEFVVEKLEGHGRVLCVGGLLDLGEDKGVSRISAFCDTLRKKSKISVLHCPTAWRYDQAYPLVHAILKELGAPMDAIFGISDSLALAGRDAARALGMVTPKTVIVGINGDALALAAIAEGSYTATVETSAEDLGFASVDLAYQATQGKPLPKHYSYRISLVTAENVVEHAARKLYAIADVPSRLVGVNREEEQHRLVQLETSAAINQRVGSLLDRRQLSREIADLIRVNYGFDDVQLLMWSEPDQMLYVDGQAPSPVQAGIPLEKAGLLGEAIRRNETIFIPDTRHSQRYSVDPTHPETRARVVLPIRLGGKVSGLLDLHSSRPVLNLRWSMIGLQLTADQLGIALRNAELYSEALAAQASAERADQLKTRLLANVSHELRTPLNVILGYSQAALSTPNLYGMELPENLRRDLRYIYQSGEHLIRVINDLLDLSRAEVGELNIFPEPVDPRSVLTDIFDSMAKTRGRDCAEVCWEIHIPRRLPVIQADPIRLRQILLNLLSNASKFTATGQISLGAVVEPPYLHIWVSDSGLGIPVEQQERIFEPFVTSEDSARRKGGIGLGLSITRRLVALHGGSISLESQPKKGSTFHIYWPLPNLAGSPPLPHELGSRPALLLMAGANNPDAEIPEEVRLIASRRGVEIRQVGCADALDDLLREVEPVALAWDLYNAAPADWSIIQRMRYHPQLSNLPLLLFEQETDCGTGMGITNVLMKPFYGKKLADLIESLRPQAATDMVLVVDDDPQARQLYQHIIVNAFPGSSILFAENGAQAITIMKENIPALVILDLMMPKMDGFQVLECMRMDQRTCKVPVIVLSGKMLTFEDVARLNFANVTFHSKGMLSPEEIIQTLQQTFSGEARLGQPTSLIVKQALAYLHQNFSQAVSRAKLAEAVGVSDNYLTQIFRQELGLSPTECLNRLRIQRARELLQASDDSVTCIATKVGFEDPAYFSRVFRKLSGCSPQAFRQRG